MALYLRDFPEYFGATPIRDIGLLASEGRMSIPLEDGTPAGLLDVTANFFEFIPIEEHESRTPTVFRAEQLEIGREYFIVATNSAGFYRYDIGDVIRVTAYAGPTPIIEFLHKGLHTSSLAGEKLTEQQVVMAFERARREVGFDSARFVLAPRWDDPPWYRLHVELNTGQDPMSARLADRMDTALLSLSVEYASKRKSLRLGPIRGHLVRPNFLVDAMLARRSVLAR